MGSQTMPSFRAASAEFAFACVEGARPLHTMKDTKANHLCTSSIKRVTPCLAYFSSTGKSPTTVSTTLSSISLPSFTLANSFGIPTGFCDPSSIEMAVVDSSLTLPSRISSELSAPAEGGVGSISMGAGPGRMGGSVVVVLSVVEGEGAGGKNSGRNSTSGKRMKVSAEKWEQGNRTYRNRRRFGGRR